MMRYVAKVTIYEPVFLLRQILLFYFILFFWILEFMLLALDLDLG